MSRAPSTRTRLASWSLRKRVTRAAVAAFVLLALIFVIVLLSLLDYKRKGDELIGRWQPAYTASQDLLSDLVNQETGVRGFTLGRNDSFLAPYRDYEKAQKRNEQALRGHVAGRPDLTADLDAFDTVARQWRTRIAQPYIARVRANDPSVVAAAASDAAKTAFDKVRAASAKLTRDIATTRDRAARERVAALRFVWVSVGVAALVILLFGFVLLRGLQVVILDPIERLAIQTRHVAQGAIGEKIIGSGPPELENLGNDVDSMRARITAELARVELARVRLIERGEELARSNADLEQFAYVASHDLSEPLRKVSNFCQLLERQYGDQLDEKAKQYIAFAVDGAKRMQVLIADLLSFSRVGRTTESFDAVDTDEALTRALATLDDRIAASGAEIVRGPMPVVDGDMTLIVALLQNLVGNALKYRSSDRAPRVEISARMHGADWLFTVSDNGIGIDPQYAERIFTIFQRLHLRDQYGGTGIGLALCRKIVEFHRGKIWLGESESPGATFHFTIPEHGDPGDSADVA